MNYLYTHRYTYTYIIIEICIRMVAIRIARRTINFQLMVVRRSFVSRSFFFVFWLVGCSSTACKIVLHIYAHIYDGAENHIHRHFHRLTTTGAVASGCMRWHEKISQCLRQWSLLILYIHNLCDFHEYYYRSGWRESKAKKCIYKMKWNMIDSFQRMPIISRKWSNRRFYYLSMNYDLFVELNRIRLLSLLVLLL